MNLKEHNDNRFTKEKDKVEKYLLRIIQRYFDIENNFTQESIEAIIIESITRFKQLMIAEKGFIPSLNRKTGLIGFDIRDLNGERSINKNTAFNKSFGNEEDTICEGNDIRLFNKREPLAHIHEITSVKAIEEELAKVEIPKCLYIHRNLNVLDMIKYTGTKTQIDLVVLGNLKNAVNEYYNNLLSYKRELRTAHEKNIDILLTYIPQIQQTIDNLIELVSSASDWLKDIYKYTDSSLELYKARVMREMTKYVTKEQAELIKNSEAKHLSVILDGEIPLGSGSVSLIPVSKPFVATNDSRGSLMRTLYNEGIKIEPDSWTWDSINQTLKISSLEFGTIPTILSPYKFTSYTHKVTLFSELYTTYPAKIVIAYDEETNSDLSLIVSFGSSLIPSNKDVGTVVTTALNCPHSDIDESDLIVSSKRIGDVQFWRNLTYGFSVLIKRDKNNVKIWIANNYAEPVWSVVKRNGIEDIFPSEEPFMEFNFTDHPELNMFIDKECSFGYGSHGQPELVYKNVHFSGETKINDLYGHTNAREFKETVHQVLGMTNEDKIKMFFRYEENGKTTTLPLPYVFVDENNNTTVIQGVYSNNGIIKIQSNYVNQIPLYATNNNLYDDKTVIAIDNTSKDIYHFAKTRVEDLGGSICTIDSEAKNTFVSKLLKENTQYYIDGEKSFIDTNYIGKDNNALEYFKWANNYPDNSDSNNINIVIENGLWKNVKCTEELSVIAEYKIKKLTECFKNPRVYYQVLGNREVT